MPSSSNETNWHSKSTWATWTPKEEFGKAKGKLEKLTEGYEPFEDAVEESAGNVLAALGLVGDEVLGSYDRIRKSLQ